RANVYPHREFLARGRQGYIRSCRHCQADTESSARIIRYCPAVQEAHIKRHNQLCQILSEEAQKKDWVVIQEPNTQDDQNHLYKPGLVFVKENQALVVNITMRYEGKDFTLEEVAKEKVEKYQHLQTQIQEMTNETDIKLFNFPLGTHAKWFQGNYKLLQILGLSKSRQERTAHTPVSRVLFTSVDIVHIL
ncbi:hypothetical protein N310_06943, partial [Acanthisitta chloris]